MTGQEETIMRSIARGLEYFHSKNILHRDIKAMNVAKGSLGRIKLADFGLAVIKDTAASLAGVHVFLLSKVVGQPYMAPEVMKKFDRDEWKGKVLKLVDDAWSNDPKQRPLASIRGCQSLSSKNRVPWKVNNKNNAGNLRANVQGQTRSF